MVDKDKFCIAPFVQMVCRTNGEALPCCYYSNPGSDIKANGIKKEWQNLGRVRDVMFDGNQTDTICKEQCYDREKAGLPSERLGILRTFGFNRDPLIAAQEIKDRGWDQLDFPKKVELHASNICNLKCLTCHPRDSSAFLSETLQISTKFKKRSIQDIDIRMLDQSQFQYTDEQLAGIMDEVMTHDIDILDLRGGETMMVPYIQKRLIALPSEKKEKISIRIQTNGTVLNDNWKEILKTFRDVRLQLSIDAVGDDIHYIRYPTNWELVLENLEFVRKLANIKLTVSCVVSNLNLPVLWKFLRWADSENYNWGLSTVNDPKIYQPNNLPADVLKMSIDKLSSLRLKEHVYTGSIDYLCSLEPMDDPILWREFCKTISLRDAWRKNSIFDIHPYLRDHWVN